MKIYDISMEIKQDMMVYKNKPEKYPTLTTASDFSTGSSYETNISFNLHTGTHIDFSKHMLQNGEVSTNFDISKLIRKVKVLDLTQVEDGITKENLSKFEITKDDFVLLKTKNSFAKEFDFNFVYLEKSGAEHLANIGISGVGIDALGVERSQPNHDTHKMLFSNNIIILEGVNLSQVNEGDYNMIALPLNIEGVEALPVRAILTEL